MWIIILCMSEIEQLEQAIAALEAQRGILGDGVVAAALGPMREKLAALKAQAQPVGQARKQVTVLFADVSGFTALSEMLDAEDVANIMNDLWQRLDVAITSFGGMIDKHIGDAVMALWGVGQAHEDDPELAIRAGLRMQVELAAFAATRPEAPLQMRIGVHTGPVLLGMVGTTGEFTAMGDTVNLASRLEHAAPVGGILISHDTYRQVRGVFDVQVLDPVMVKGKVEPVQVYVVQRSRPRAFHLGTRGVEGVETRMIGRDAELRQLKTALDVISAQHTLQAITVVGEAGMGKSRLLYEFVAWLDVLPEIYLIFKGRAHEETQRSPYALLRSLFAFRFQIQDSDSGGVAREKLVQGILSLGVGLDEMKAHFIGHLIGLDFSDSPHLQGILDDPRQIHDRAFHYLAQFFMAAAKQSDQAGCVVLLEDLHWADDGSLDAFTNVMQACSDMPLFILGLARPTLYERRSQWGEGVRGHARLNLHLLSKDESRQLVGEILKKAPEPPPELCELVVGGAEGNPFYIEEFLKMLIDQKVILPGPEQWRIEVERLVGLRVPPSLVGVLQARLDGLLPDERMVLQRASVVGRIFWDDAIRALGDEHLKADVLASTLLALRAKELIFRRDRSAFVGAEEYVFKHVILRDVTYESVLKRQRKIYHAQAANWLLEHSGERSNQFAGLIAGHFEQAGENALAANWFGCAGTQASKAYAPELAIGHFQKALQLQELSPILAPQLALEWYEGLGKALRTRARYDEAVETYIAMRRAAEAAQDILGQARAWSGLSFAQSLLGGYQASLESAEQAERIARVAMNAGMGGNAQVELAAALHRKGTALHRLRDMAGALTLGEQGLALAAQAGDAPGAKNARARCLLLLGMAHNALGHLEQAEDCLEKSLALYREMGDRQNVGAMLNNLGEIARLRGDYAAAIKRYQEALALTREIGYRGGEMLHLSNLGGARVGMGEYAAAEADLHQVLSMVEMRWLALSETYHFLAEALLGQEKLVDAREAAKRALELGRASGRKEHVAGAWRALGNCGARAGDFYLELSGQDAPITDAAYCYAESVRLYGELGDEAERARTLRDWARYERARGREKHGLALWLEAKAIFERLYMPLEVARMEE